MSDDLMRRHMPNGASVRGILRSLVRSESGNVLAMTAAATIPMLGVIGGAVDISRVYITKSRLQAACDSAVLAGRKAMDTTTYTTEAEDRANSMFAVNFRDDNYGTSATSFESSADEEGKVTGTAQTTVPMVLMQIFGAGSQTVDTICSADIQIPNIDVVLVLDVTGSMDSRISGKKKIDSLKEAAKEFYDTLAEAMIGNTTSQIRYGLVPYAEAVNGADVFKTSADFDKGELPLSHFVNTMTVQSRVANMTTPSSRFIPDPASSPTSFEQTFNNGQQRSKEPFEAYNGSGTEISDSNCNSYASNSNFSYGGSWWGGGTSVSLSSRIYRPEGSSNWQSNEPTSSDAYIKATFERVSGSFNGDRTCTRRVTHMRYIKERGYRFTSWDYRPVDYDVSGYKSGTPITYLTSIDSSALVPTSGRYDLVQLASAGAGSTATTTWNGCIEERDTVSASTFAPIPANAYDLNVIDGGASQETRWRPMLRDLTHDRQRTANRNNTSSNYGNPAFSCPSARMQSLNVMTKGEFDAHIDALEPEGNTYLDVGMVWGLRLIAAQGMFAERNLVGPNGGQISRHIIFLTDGEPVSNSSRYTAYGVERMEERITGGSSNPSAATRHARRFQALCDSQRGAISIWAIAFGTSVTGNLEDCADPGRAFQANDTDELKDAFKRIAQEVADLRLVE